MEAFERALAAEEALSAKKQANPNPNPNPNILILTQASSAEKKATVKVRVELDMMDKRMKTAEAALVSAESSATEEKELLQEDSLAPEP